MSRATLAVSPSGPLRGTIEVPGDKSITHRALIFAALAEGRSEVTDPSPAADCRSTAACLRRLGVTISRRGTTLLVTGCGNRGLAEPDDVLDCGNSGTTMRLLAGVLAGQRMQAVLSGDASLRNRPMERVMRPLRLMGAQLTGRGNDRFPPLVIRGAALSGIEYKSPVASAQIKSSILLAALAAQGPTAFTEPEASRDHTERMLPHFGALLKIEGTTVTLNGPQGLAATAVRVPGDLSSAAFWVVAALTVPGSRVRLEHVGLNPGRTGFLGILRRMGARLAWEIAEHWNGEPVGWVEAEYGELSGTRIGGAEIPAAIDELPILAVAAAAAHGLTTIADAAELRVKETDRIRAVASQLTALGARVEETTDGMIIDGGHPLTGAHVASCGDHRMAMSLAVAGLAARGGTVIHDPACIAVSYPDFFATLHRLTR